MVAFIELHLLKSQCLTRQLVLNLQESFIIIRGKKADSDRWHKGGFKGRAWLELVGPLWKGFGERELGKRHLAHKLDVRLAHTY